MLRIRVSFFSEGLDPSNFSFLLVILRIEEYTSKLVRLVLRSIHRFLILKVYQMMKVLLTLLIFIPKSFVLQLFSVEQVNQFF